MENLAELLQIQGDLRGALQTLEASMAIARQLAERDPANAQWQRDLFVNWQRIGDVLQAQDDVTGALKSYHDSLGIAEKLAKQDPGNAGWQSFLAWTYWRTGSMWAQVEPKSKNEARGMLEKGRNILRQLKERTALACQQEWLDSVEADLRKMREKN
jgi:hypothetical protein